MTAKPQLENGVFELLDRLGDFISEHSLVFLVGIITLTVLGGVWLLVVLRNNRATRPPEAGTGLTVRYGILIGNRPPSQETPPPFTNAQPENWDDKRD
jgi:hypothetical protein